MAGWLGYQAPGGDQRRYGAVSDAAGLDEPHKVWTAPLGGEVHGQVLATDSAIIAATETNRVVALRPADGTQLWSTSLGRPLTNVVQVAGCGSIDPLGVTSTPVIDPATGTVFVVAEIVDNGAVHHELFGLSLSTGAIRMSADVDPPLPANEPTKNLLQRASLALVDGRVYIPFGGNNGDCGHYHGWLVSVTETGTGKQAFEVASDGEGGAIWQGGGAPAVDTDHTLYVTTGNANPFPAENGPDPLKFAESAVALSPALRPLASFKDPEANQDLDLSTGNPVVLPGGEIFTVGKTQVAFFLRAGSLAKLAAVRGVCGSNPNGGPAYDPRTRRLFVPCRGDGVQMIDVASHQLLSKLPHGDGPPIVVGPQVWVIDHSNGTLYGYETSTGRLLRSVRLDAQIPIFDGPSYAAGTLLIPTSTGVTALRGT
ncbi:PQQ-binding-like beta-propeller repeat protein [Frankia sp. AgB1.9]|uniref:outer membrane protein assembly factor BamB family protein n=1 Tax=unclassified Frankia TaxID=2632575 RepID=UPI001933F116|nr:MULTISPECIES: PQQ-binding-like beta-propeller repeat protein [unclassified Frankia]MBL7487987.1 PQQ-binding-like beta-propeller repeat protein [Frankia sp. AgW1.1]MBL7549425.1 PQQ-binding-like beta-propeller repeat protein [Frankia sp. AgB1.9]MBL7622342.1 PQQ-binding-like beta-propeller repeat protein [Frankia sp. AgB1.8]